NWNTDRTGLIGDCAGYRLADPPSGVGREFIASTVFKLLNRFHKAHVPLLDEIEEGKTAIGVFLRNRDHKTQVRFDHFALRLLALIHPALQHSDVFFELFKIAPRSELSFI